MKITKKELALAGIFAVLGIIFSSKSWILFLNTLTPLQGFGIYYLIVFIALFILSMLGLVVFDVKIKNILQVLGTTLVLFAFFCIFNWESSWVTYVVQQSTNLTAVPIVFYGSEDGMLFDFVVNNVKDYEFARILTFGVGVFVITLIGLLFLENKPKITP